MPANYQTSFEEADGTKTPTEKWFGPKPGLLSAPMSEASKERSRKKMEKQDPEMIERGREALKSLEEA